MCFWKKKQEEESKSVTRDKIDTILDLVVGLNANQFKNLMKGIEKFYDGYSTIRGVKTPEDKEKEKEQKDAKKIDAIESELKFEKLKEKKK